MIVEWWAWAGFLAFVAAMLALDLFVLHRNAHEVSIREAGMWSAIWVALGLSFGAVLWVWQGGIIAEEYLAGYLIEKSLSVDNVFVFALIFSYFNVPARYQHRVLMWGIIGALVLRAGFITAGAALLDAFHFTIYIFGAILLVTAVKVLRHGDAEIHPERNPVLRLLRRVIPIGTDFRGQRFFVRENGVRMATPLFAVLVVIETTDVIFAVDSIPAIFAVTENTFVVFTSNTFALLGMRALYFLLAGASARFRYLKIGLGVVLGAVGVKLLLTDVYHVPIWLSLAGIATILTVAFLASLLAGPKRPVYEIPLEDDGRDDPAPPPALSHAKDGFR